MDSAKLFRTVSFSFLPKEAALPPFTVDVRRSFPFLIFNHFQTKMTRSIVWRGVRYFAPGVFWISHSKVDLPSPSALDNGFVLIFANGQFQNRAWHVFNEKCGKTCVFQIRGKRKTDGAWESKQWGGPFSLRKTDFHERSILTRCMTCFIRLV